MGQSPENITIFIRNIITLVDLHFWQMHRYFNEWYWLASNKRIVGIKCQIGTTFHFTNHVFNACSITDKVKFYIEYCDWPKQMWGGHMSYESNRVGEIISLHNFKHISMLQGTYLTLLTLSKIRISLWVNISSIRR